METAEEPQKKVFKARKTMKASDRQQLEALHKAKEDRLKPTEQKLVNGIHENGTSDMNYNHNDKEPMEGTQNLNGILEITHDSHEIPVVKLSDLREELKHVDQTSDLKLTLDLELNESTVSQEDGKTTGPTETPIETGTTEEDQGEKVTDDNVEQLDSSERFLEDISCEPESSEEQTQSDIPNEVESCSTSEETKLEGENAVEEPIAQELENEEEMDVVSENPTAKAGDEIEDGDLIKEPLDANTEESADIIEKDDIAILKDDIAIEKDDIAIEEPENQASNEELHSETQNDEETENPTEEQESTELVNEPRDTNSCSPDMNMEENSSPSEDKKEISESEVQQNNIGDEAISSSMEVDQNVKNLEEKSLTEEAPCDKSVSNTQTGSGLENVEEMETDEIIPILEKLAPVEDLQCFTEAKTDFETVPNEEEEKAETSATSPTKNDTSETLPREAFLVLSDEEEPCVETTPPKECVSTDQDEVKEVIEEPEEKADDDHKEPEAKDEPQAEKSDLSRRKRSKSEDLDSQSSKRRRFEGEEYEAELKVKITAGDDLNEKLQKVIQKMFEEKLSALQCLDFDKEIAELKSRVEKIECKKHETALHSMQARITRLTKRFGAAKEDLKKKPELPAPPAPAAPPASPAKTAVNDSAQNANMTNFRNSGTVRQMLETKRVASEIGTASVQPSPSTPSSAPSSANLTLRASSTTQMSTNQSPASNTLQNRPPPDWKLIQQKINASTIGASQNTMSSQSKSVPTVTSTSVMTPVLQTPATATVVGNTQVSTSNTQPMSVSLQSLPVILHVPVAVNSQSQILQGATGTLVTNQQSGNVEFIQVQNQSTVNNLTKTPVSIPVSKTMNSPSMANSGIQRNSSSINSPMTVQAMPTSHSVTLSSRQSLPNVVTSSVYNQTSNRNTAQLKSPISSFNNSTATTELPSGSRSDLQISRAETVSNKRSSTDGSAMGGKPAPGVIDLTLDEEEAESSSHDSRRNNSSLPASVQASQPIGRQLQPLQTNTVQTSSVPAGLPSQTTIHVLPTAQTTVNITQRPGTQTTPRAPAPRATTNQHMVYTTTTLPNVAAQSPIRNTVMQNQNIRQVTPQTSGVNVRMPQTTAYVVNNNGMSISSNGPQLTVHHRPPQQEPARPIHPAPLPEAPQPQRLPPEASSTSPPQKPHLKLARVQSQNGIVLSWSVLEVDRTCAIVDSYHLYAYHEDPSATSSSQWKKIGEVKALPLPMACTLTQFVSGSKYYFAVRAKDVYGRFGPFCDPQSTDVISTQSS
ncbi:activating transcription factor 7-interacting protein 1 [Hyla sarda]|uniref:activating transcription factor 7-interacting protein 1 n=1 Tax=Hyla sarda TaxID=327740 RepID=UPI0024C38313|nr:activating transcription factor 7-interacting protein 1 [Hyla sarda]XP_056379762.1 activating transcription factor 7-interacting protein 1 [Hyla sarda]XP_056379763.1 activating transcription factor 7-interacting protein 1 [Hyla sarda]XP_056379764.1 activating transcription factor 7-interacting protein 1 [Hyla sarda]